MQTIKLINADVIVGLKTLADESVDLIVTSPAYWGLRDYQNDGQIGLEPTLGEYHDRLLDVTSELKRVLKPTGAMFWNHGDSYAGSGGPGGDYNDGGLREGQPKPKKREWLDPKLPARKREREMVNMNMFAPKCMVMQNERLIIRMVDEQGWILRNRIIWHKSNGMPSSVEDRFTNKYEPVYMLVKNKKYWFDLDAVRIPTKYQEVWSRKGSGKDTPYDQNNPRKRYGLTKHEIATQRTSGTYSDPLHTNPIHPSGMKNPGDVWDIKSPEDDWKQLLEVASELVGTEAAIAIFESYMESRDIPSDVWTIPTQPYPESHFATFPLSLIEPMIKAACPSEVCPECGHIRERITEYLKAPPKNAKRNVGGRDDGFSQGQGTSATPRRTTGWTTCSCGKEFEPGVVLDPFSGAATTLLAARNLGRSAIGVEISTDYCKIAKKRVGFDQSTIDGSIEYIYKVIT